MPIAFTIGIVSAGVLVFSGISLEIMVQRMFAGVNNFSYLALPLFILAGNIMGEGGLTRRLMALADALVGRFSGGLGMTAVVTSAFFELCPAQLKPPLMQLIRIVRNERQKYSNSFIASIIGPAGVLGLIIPPSITMVILGITTNISIGKLFIAGFLPGILLTIVLCIYVSFMSKKKGFGAVEQTNPTGKEFLKIAMQAFFPLMAPIFILGGIFSGLVTATEAAVIAVVYGFILSIFYKRINA